MAKGIKVTLDNNVSNEPIQFKHPNTGTLQVGTLQGNSSLTWGTVFTNLTPGDYALFYAMLAGQSYSFVVPTITIPDLTPPTSTRSFPYPVRASLGAYEIATGKKLRNLWSAVAKPAGPVETIVWNDRIDEDGVAITLADSQMEYRLTYQAEALKVVWEGVIGNTSDSFTQYVWRSLATMQDFCVAPGGESFAGLGYNEALPAIVRSPVGTYQAPRAIKGYNFMDSWAFVRHDGTYLYAVSNNSGWDNRHSSYAVRLDPTTFAEVPWASGTDITCISKDPNGIPTQTHTRCLFPRQFPTASLQMNGETDRQFEMRLRANYDQNRITGFADNANYIAGARKGQGAVLVSSKTSGALLNTLSIPTPGHVSFATSGDLWTITAAQVKRVAVGSNASSFTVQNTLPSVTLALALDAHPNQDLVLMADAGSTHLVKAYNAAGVLQWTLDDDFWFQMQDPLAEHATDRDAYGELFTFVKWEPNGTFWVLNTANCCVRHYDANRQYLGEIAYLPDRLKLAGDMNDPTTVVSGMIPFKVSIDPLKPGDQSLSASPSWKRMPHLGKGLDIQRFRYVVNLATHNFPGGNGLRYGFMPDSSIVDARAKLVEFEFPTTGGAFPTGTTVDDWGGGGMSHDQYPDGSLRAAIEDRYINTPTFPDGGLARVSAVEQTLTGYQTVNGRSVPQRTAEREVFAINSNLDRGTDPVSTKPPQAQQRIWRLGNGNYVTYKSSKTNPAGYHLGIVKPGGTSWLIKFYKATTDRQPGTYPDADAFGGLDGANAFASDRSIVVLYNGQNNDQSNTFNHFDDNGLVVGLPFGAQAGNTAFGQDDAPAAFSGNNLDMYMVKVPNAKVLHVYTVDEAIHAGLARYRVSTDFDTYTIPVAADSGSNTYSFTPADASQSRISTGVQDVLNVSSSDQLKTLLSSALTNKKIVIADGTYTDNYVQTGAWDNVWLTSASNNTTIANATYSVLLILQGQAVRSRVRISHLSFNYTGTGSDYALLYWNELGTYNGLEIDHCTFNCPNGDVNALGCSQFSTSSNAGNFAKDVYIHDNNFPNVGRIAIELLNYGFDQVRLTNLRIDSNTFGNLGLQDGRHGMAISLSGLIKRVGLRDNVSNGGKYCIYELVKTQQVIAENNSGMSQDVSTVEGQPSACSGWSISKDANDFVPKDIYITGGTFDVAGRPIQVYDAVNVVVDGAGKLWKGHRGIQMNLSNSRFKGLNVLIQSAKTEPEASFEVTAGSNNTFQDSTVSSAGSAAAGLNPAFETFVLRSGVTSSTLTNIKTILGLRANGQPYAPSPADGSDGRIVDQGSGNTITNNTYSVAP